METFLICRSLLEVCFDQNWCAMSWRWASDSDFYSPGQVINSIIVRTFEMYTSFTNKLTFPNCFNYLPRIHLLICQSQLVKIHRRTESNWTRLFQSYIQFQSDKNSSCSNIGIKQSSRHSNYEDPSRRPSENEIKSENRVLLIGFRQFQVKHNNFLKLGRYCRDTLFPRCAWFHCFNEYSVDLSH